MANKTLAGLKPNPKNPRKITDAKARMLRDSLARFGDISGLVFNRTSGQLVGGHQRVEAFKALGAHDVTITKQYDVPSHAGTVAEGYVDISGERYAYRETQWDDATEKAANLAANKGAGEWDLAQVGNWIQELDAIDFDIDLTMFDEADRAGLLPHPGGINEDWDEALDKVPEGEQGGLKTTTFTLSREQHDLVMQRLDAMKKLGPFVDTGNDNSNGNALARLAEMYHG
ncbi:MAG: hypothetical protein EOO63_06565 [Hymenobacter sp.]|nr:MAG: hypothetical protein EOO63_06565 [Hymenobacter sp.]